MFVRVVGEYERRLRQDDAARRLAHQPADLHPRRRPASISSALRHVDRTASALDWLFSYQPTPGTVFFAGYGSSLEEPDVFGDIRRPYRRVSDGFFAKISYLFRL